MILNHTFFPLCACTGKGYYSAIKLYANFVFMDYLLIFCFGSLEHLVFLIFLLFALQHIYYPHLVMQIIFLGVQYPKIILKSPIWSDLHMLNPASLRTQENNFGSKYVENISRLFWKRPATGK